jgi:hypothetical protein
MVKLYSHRKIEIATRPPAATRTCSCGDAETQRKVRSNPYGTLGPSASARDMFLAASGRGGQNVQNKPNSRGRDTPPFYCSIILPFPADDYRAKQSQSPDCGFWISDCGLGQICRLRPVQADCAKRTQFRAVRLGPADETCETNPIWESVGREPVLSSPKERPTHEEWRGNRAKQTQFPAAPDGTGPQGRGLRGKMCDIASMPRFGKQSQTWAGWNIWGTVHQGGGNRATSPRCPASGNKANFGGQRLGDEGRLCKTNPIPTDRPGRPSPRPPALRLPPVRREVMQNKPNFRLPRCPTIPV